MFLRLAAVCCAFSPFHMLMFSADGALLVTGEDVVWTGGPSPTMSLQVSNSAEPTQSILSFQLRLQLIPDGATGEVYFASATVPPDNYVLPAPIGLSAVGEDSAELSVADFSFAPGMVPFGESFGLVDLQFEESSSNAPAGRFLVMMIVDSDDGGSFYVDGTGQPLPFENASVDALLLGTVTLGDVGVAAPEPLGVYLFVIGAMVIFGCKGPSCRRAFVRKLGGSVIGSIRY